MDFAIDSTNFVGMIEIARNASLRSRPLWKLGTAGLRGWKHNGMTGRSLLCHVRIISTPNCLAVVGICRKPKRHKHTTHNTPYLRSSVRISATDMARSTPVSRLALHNVGRQHTTYHLDLSLPKATYNMPQQTRRQKLGFLTDQLCNVSHSSDSASSPLVV